MSDMLERVARAMWEQRRRYVQETMPDVGPLEEWGDGSVPRSNGVFEEAREAVEAMREPTHKMVMAMAMVHVWERPMPEDSDTSDMTPHWRAAIDEALK